MGIRNLLCCCLLFMGTNSQFIEYSNSTIRDKRQNTSYKCTLPQHPPNGRWMIINGDGNPGDEIEINTIVKLECIDGYRLEPPQPFMFCNSEWDPSAFPKCQKKCPAFYSTATTALKCDENGKNVHCDQAIDGTYLTSKCIPYYEVPPGSKSTLYCTGGTWSFPKPVCQPVCGKKVNNETKPLSWRGNDVKDLEYPWVIALYQKIGSKFKNICGGTMVSRRVVLTAAHCVTNDYGNVLPKENFQIAAGKYYNAYDDERDKEAQFRELAKLIVHDDYRGESRRYVADIAIIITKILFRLGPFVQPVCINNIDSIYLTNRQMGEVAGWGLTEHNRAAERLRVVKVPYKEGATCSRELPPEWEEKYNFFDKICAGHFQKNISVCQGDSGSGLVFKNSEDNRYYIHGIVSIAPNLYTSQCNYETNALYTSIAKHYGFIDREMTKYYVEDCVLPKHPKNGQWQLENDADKSPGDIVPSTSILKYSCNRGYKLSSASEFFECKNTYNPPTCTVRCRKLSFPAGTNTICKNNKEQVIDCEEASEGSSITFTCPKGYTSDQGTQSSTRYCINGLYGTPRPDCVFGRVAKPKPTTSHSVGADGTKVICTYVSQWAYQGVLPEDFDPNMCTHLVYDFIGIWDKGDVRVQDDALDLDQEERGLYNRVNDLKKKNKNLKVLLSVGGEATSNTTLFTRVSRNARKTGGFLGSAGHFIKTYHFDGLNIDWQYPDEDDAGNYIRFLETIKDEFDRNNWILSASVRPDFDKTGYNIKEMNRLLHWVTIKTYDFYDAFSSYTGSHNALFPSSKENKWGKDHLNIENVAGNWLKAGLSKEKMVLSVAFHGRSFILKDKAQHGIHAPVTGPGPGVDGGVLRYYEICSKYKNGFQEGWDDETKSAYRYNDTVWISFNTKDTVWTRGEYIKKNGYAGINIYPWDGDDNKGICGERYILLKHVNGGLGYPMAWNET